MLNSTVRGNKAWWSVLGMCLGLLSSPAFSANYSTVFAFDLHYTAAGVVEGTGSNMGTLFGTTYDAALTYGGSIYKVAMGGGAPQIIYQLKETDGYSPQATLLVGTDGYLYGSTYYGPRLGTNTQAGSGTIFRVAQDGSGFTTLHVFGAIAGANTITANLINSDGMRPSQALIEDSTYLYGVTQYGGVYGSGVVFRVRKADGATDVLHQFASTDVTGINSTGEGAYPSSKLTLASDGRLYGVTFGGGANLKTASDGTTAGTGTIYSLNVDGTGFQTVYNFSALDNTATTSPGVNGGGAQPSGALLEISPGVLIGTASVGGNPNLNPIPNPAATGYGTVFRFDTTVTPKVLSTLYNFDNTNGATPRGNLVLGDDGLVYGVTTSGSSTSTPVTLLGSLFSINPSTRAYTIVHPLISAEGSGFTGGLIKASNGDLFGTVQYGNACTGVSSSGYGAVFRYSLATGASSSGYSNCTVYSSGGGGSMAPGLLWLLAVLGLAPPVRRRLFGFN